MLSDKKEDRKVNYESKEIGGCFYFLICITFIVVTNNYTIWQKKFW